jgi:hypothetical protein
MPPTPTRLPAWALSLALLTSAGAAAAATNTASVLITSFSATTSAGSLSWTDPYQSFAANALNAGGLLGADSDVFSLEHYGFAIAGASTSTSTAAISTTAPQTFWATASSASSFGLPTNLPNQADSKVLQSGSFAVTQAGTVTFTIGYTLAVSAVGGNAATDYGLSSIAFDLAGTTPGGGALTDSLASFAQASGAASRSGSFTLTLALAPGATGFYTLQGGALAFATAAAVPEPAGWLLLSAGLSALLLRRRLTQP